MNKTFLLLILSFCTLTFSQDKYSYKTEINELNNETEEVPFAVIENVPVYKGCDKNMKNSALRKCMNSKISDLVAKNFNSSLAYTLGLPVGKVRISVTFKINQEGNIIDIKANASHPYLEKEAIRVVKLISKMKPGMVRGKAVTVPYSLPIMFQVDNSKKDKKTYKKEAVNTPDNFPVYKGCNENLDNENLKKCTTKKIINFLKLSFNMDLADKLFPQDKSTQFKVDFIINKKGRIENINVQAHKREIAVEAISVLKRLPKLKKPGFSNGKPVNTSFSILMTLYLN